MRLLMLLMLMASLCVPGNVLGQNTLNISGAGTETDPYLIGSPDALAWFRDWVNGTYTPDEGSAETHPEACAKLTADINMSSVCHPSDEAKNIAELSWTPISNSDVQWNGSFDGGGHTISNLYINTTSDNAGLFGYVGKKKYTTTISNIKDIIFSNVNITSTSSYSGVLAGSISMQTTVSGITVERGTVNGGYYSGGIVGYANYSVISNCINQANIKASLENVGGICGYINTYCTIERCTNYGTIEGSREVGGIVGVFSDQSKITNCANCGDIKGSSNVGGIIGWVNGGSSSNGPTVFSCGNVTCTSQSNSTGGILFGYVSRTLNINGIAAYSSDAILTMGSSAVEAKAIGSKDDKATVNGESNCRGYTNDIIKSGLVAWLLQDGNENEVWGQNLSEETKELYPVLGSKKVYPYGDVYLDCSNTTIMSGKFTNTESGGKYTDIPYRDYHKFGSDGLCTTCHYAAPKVIDGNNSISVKAVSSSGTLENQQGYTIYKYVATGDGTLYIIPEGDSDTYGTLWNTDFTLLASNDDRSNEEKDFFISYDVVNGTTYFIGVRKKDGAAIDGTYTLRLIGSWSPEANLIKPVDLIGSGTPESPFELKNAKHLLWFSHYVNGTYEPEAGKTATPQPEACAKMMADIALSSVCHPADAENNVEEVSWIPIGKDYKASWYGTFDGCGHTISNLYYTINSYAGLFGYIKGKNGNPGTIKNIIFTNVFIDSTILESGAGAVVRYGDRAGAVASYAEYTNISGIAVESGQIKGCISTGGIVGYSQYGNISNCTNKSDITSIRGTAGGICGTYSGGSNCSISNCANYGNISGESIAGGIVGTTYTYSYNTIKDVFTSGNVTTKENDTSLGFVVGQIRDKLTFEGVIAFNNEATLKYKEAVLTGKAVGEKYNNATVTGEGIPQGYTIKQQSSGYLTYDIMNSSKSDGTQAWYQKLGEDGDAWPVLRKTGSNTVYCPNYCTCDGKKVLHTFYSNSPDNLTAPHVYKPSEEENAETKLHDYVCTECSTLDSEHKAIKDFNKAGEYLQINVGEDGSYSVDELTLYDTNDAKLYNSPVALNVGNLTYVRQLTHGGFSPLYVPFALTPEQCDGELNLYAINNFHERENAEGGYDVTLEVKKVTAGNTMANRPYVFKPQNYSGEDNTVTLNLGETTLQPRQNSSISCCSMSYTYTFNGTYDAKALNSNSASDYAMYQGEIRKVSDNVTISPQRWYLTVTDRDGYETGGGSSANAKAMAFSIYENGEGEATAIEDKRVVNDVPSSAAGIYDLQGRKLSKEPVKGMYIKNGVKYVK